MTIFRQGDVLLINTSHVPTELTPIPRDAGRVVLARGEVTGHAHAIDDCDGELFSTPDTDDRFLRIVAGSGVALRHEEHATIALPPGDYVVRTQREYTANREDITETVRRHQAGLRVRELSGLPEISPFPGTSRPVTD